MSVKLTVRVGLGFVTEIVCCDVAVCCGEPASLMVSATVNEPADEYVCVTEEPVPVDPSPKIQEKR